MRRVAERTCLPRFSTSTSIDPSSSPGFISNIVLVLLGILDKSTNFSVSNHAKQAHWRMLLECQQNLQKTVSVLSGESFSLDYKAPLPCRHRLQKINETYYKMLLYTARLHTNHLLNLQVEIQNPSYR
jgi:hypothetical protein